MHNRPISLAHPRWLLLSLFLSRNPSRIKIPSQSASRKKPRFQNIISSKYRGARSFHCRATISGGMSREKAVRASPRSLPLAMCT